MAFYHPASPLPPCTRTDNQIDYFNKRRILEFRQAKTLAEAARQREEAARR